MAAALRVVMTGSTLADQLAQAELHILPGAGHMSPFVDPRLLADLLRAAAATA